MPIGKENIDLTDVFRSVLSNFDGNIVFKLIQSDEDIIEAKIFLGLVEIEKSGVVSQELLKMFGK
ncbi:MAG: hypothetical protein WAP54_02890 [Bacteroidales bacterium]